MLRKAFLASFIVLLAMGITFGQESSDEKPRTLRDRVRTRVEPRTVKPPSSKPPATKPPGGARLRPDGTRLRPDGTVKPRPDASTEIIGDAGRVKPPSTDAARMIGDSGIVLAPTNPLVLRARAQGMLDAMREAGDGWTGASRIVSSSPIYLPGVAGPAFHEFKVRTGSKDAGYILVDAITEGNPVLELNTEGPTMTELYEQTVGTRPIKVYRYGFFHSVAKSDDDKKQILASMGFTGQPGKITKHRTALRGPAPPPGTKTLKDRLETFDSRFEQSVRRDLNAKLRAPGELQDRVRKPEERMRRTPPRTLRMRRPDSSSTAYSVLFPTAFMASFQHAVGNRLLHRFDEDWHTPSWWQDRRDVRFEGGGRGECPVGCGNTAWAIVYAYWDQFKGKDNLFESDLTADWDDVNDEIARVMWHIADLTDTTHGRWRWAGQEDWTEFGMTMPSDMSDGIRYARERGYPEARVVRWRGTERDKWEAIDNEIEADRPVILLINVGGNTNVGFPDHYVVIEITRHFIRTGIDTYGYYVNMGHGQNPRSGFPHKWIFPVKRGVADSAFSAFFVRMTDESGPLEIVVDDLIGRDTHVADARGRHEITFHLENMDDFTGDVQILVDAGGGRGTRLLRTVRLAELEDETFTVGDERQVLLRASCGGERDEQIIHLDDDPPTFAGIDTSPSTRTPGAIVLSARSVRDDGYWNTSDYRVRATVDGRTLPEASGISVTAAGLGAGTHHATMTIRDGAGRWSAPRTLDFSSDTSGPTVSFIAPAEGSRVGRGSEVTITIEAQDADGVMRVKVYLDTVSDDEFASTLVTSFPGVFGRTRAERRSNTVTANWSRGRHTLIAIARDNAGNSTRVERVITVE